MESNDIIIVESNPSAQFNQLANSANAAFVKKNLNSSSFGNSTVYYTVYAVYSTYTHELEQYPNIGRNPI